MNELLIVLNQKKAELEQKTIELEALEEEKGQLESKRETIRLEGNKLNREVNGFKGLKDEIKILHNYKDEITESPEFFKKKKFKVFLELLAITILGTISDILFRSRTFSWSIISNALAIMTFSVPIYFFETRKKRKQIKNLIAIYLSSADGKKKINSENLSLCLEKIEEQIEQREKEKEQKEEKMSLLSKEKDDLLNQLNSKEEDIESLKQYIQSIKEIIDDIVRKVICNLLNPQGLIDETTTFDASSFGLNLTKDNN